MKYSFQYWVTLKILTENVDEYNLSWFMWIVRIESDCEKLILSPWSTFETTIKPKCARWLIESDPHKKLKGWLKYKKRYCKVNSIKLHLDNCCKHCIKGTFFQCLIMKSDYDGYDEKMIYLLEHQVDDDRDERRWRLINDNDDEGVGGEMGEMVRWKVETKMLFSSENS